MNYRDMPMRPGSLALIEWTIENCYSHLHTSELSRGARGSFSNKCKDGEKFLFRKAWLDKCFHPACKKMKVECVIKWKWNHYAFLDSINESFLFLDSIDNAFLDGVHIGVAWDRGGTKCEINYQMAKGWDISIETADNPSSLAYIYLLSILQIVAF